MDVLVHRSCSSSSKPKSANGGGELDAEEAAGALALLPFAPLSDDLDVVLELAVAAALAARALRNVSLTFGAPEEVLCCTWPICSPDAA